MTNKEKTSVKYIALPASLPSGLNNGEITVGGHFIETPCMVIGYVADVSLSWDHLRNCIGILRDALAGNVFLEMTMSVLMEIWNRSQCGEITLWNR